MKFKVKLKNLKEAVWILQTGNGGGASDESEVDVELISDTDPNSICENMILEVSVDVPAATYDDYTSSTTKKTTVEVFSLGDNRPSRVVINQTRDLIPKKK